MLGLYVSTTRKHRFASVRPGMHCDMVNHSPDSPAPLRGEVVRRSRAGEGRSRRAKRVERAPHPNPLPVRTQGCPGKLCIAELHLHLVRGAPLLRFARIDGWRFGEGCDRSPSEQELADEFGESDRKHGDAVDPGRDAQQQIGDHRGEDLQPDGILAGAEEFADIEMLFDPSEQQFDLPSAFVEGGDLNCRAGKIVGEERHHTAVLAPDLDTAQRDRQPGVALAGEHDLVIGDDLEAIALALAIGAMLLCTKTHVRLRPGNKESPAIIELLPPVEAAIPLVEHIGCAGFDRYLTANLNIVDIGGRDLDACRNICQGIVDDMQLHAADAGRSMSPNCKTRPAGLDWNRSGAPSLCLRAVSADPPSPPSSRRSAQKCRQDGGRWRPTGSSGTACRCPNGNDTENWR